MTGRTTAGLLALSLLGNLFAAGVIAGGALALHRPGFFHPRPPPGIARPIREAGDALPAPDRARFRRALRAVVREDADLVGGARAARLEAGELFTAPQFDAAAVDAALARARDADAEIRRRLEERAVAFAATLPPDERAKLAASLRRAGPLHVVHPDRR
jgi:uncharacterized membrane protein